MSASVTIRDLLSYPVLEGARVAAGAEGLDAAIEDVGWFTGDFAATAGTVVVCAREHSVPAYKLDALIRRAHAAGAVGLLVLADDRPPLLSTLRLADRLSFPLLQAAQADPVDLVTELITMVRSPQLVRAATLVALTRQLSAKRTGAEILTTANTVLEARLGLVGPDGAALLGTELGEDEGLFLDRAVAQQGRHTLIHPVLDPDANRIAAWLLAPCAEAAEARAEILALGLAIVEPFLRSWLAAQRATAEKSQIVRAQLLSEIVSVRDSISRDHVESALSLGWRLQDWHTGIHVWAGDEIEAARSTVAGLQAELARRGIEIITCIHRADGHVMWASAEVEPGAAAGRELLRRLRQAALTLERRDQVVIGIGRPRKGPSGLADTLHEARDAYDLAASHSFRPAVEHVDELGVARLLATWQRSEVTRAFAESALAPLADSPQLLETLQAYLESGCSTVATASVLGIHRNTVGARVQQIRTRLGTDLDEPSQRLAFQVACRAIGS